MSIKRVLIGGGTGFIGRALAKELQKQSIQTCTVSRMPAPNSITWTELLEKGLPGEVDAVVNLSGQNVLDPLRRWTDGFRQNVVSSRVETNRMLSASIRQCRHSAPPKVFITISGVGYYPPHPSEEYTEDSPGGDYDFLSRLCRQWEDACQVGPETRTIAVRSGIVLGKGGGMIQSMYPLFYLGLGAKIGSGTQYMPWIHLHDLVAILIEAMRNEKLSSGVINGTAPQLITNAQFTKAFGRAMWRPAVFTFPEKVVELVFGEERAIMMTKGQKVRSKRLEELGFKFQYPDIDSALKQVVSG
ncbi:hypothetical protein TYRP_010821 [Tyrophagus putrescentiae]|nr:hypothetical protein TYRP_010821 [Tyrophagus putrescentiae]